MPRPEVGHFKLGCSIHWHVQDPGLGAGLVEGIQGLPLWTTASTGEHGSWDLGQANLGMGCSTDTHKNQNGSGPVGLGQSTSWQVLGLDVVHVRLDCSTHWEVQDLGLGMSLVWELWVFPCWVSAPTGEHVSQDWEQAPIDTFVGWVGEWIRLI